MPRCSRRIALIATAAGVIAALAPAIPASAGSTADATIGGCEWQITTSPSDPNTKDIVLYDASVTLNSEVPTSATVSCIVHINGVFDTDADYSFSGFAVQYGVDSFSIAATDSDLVDVCQRTQYADGYDTGWVCPTYDYPPWLPPEGDPFILLDPVNQFEVDHVDPVVCPVLAAHPGDYGPASITSDGDVYVPDPIDLWIGPVYDCPPYGNF